MQNIRRCSTKGAPRRRHTVERNQYLFHTQLTRKNAGVHGPRTTKGKEAEITRIKAFLNRGFSDDVGHFELSYFRDTCGRFHQPHSQRIRNALHRAHRCIFIQGNATTQEVIGVYVAHDHVGIGDGWLCIALAPTSGAGICSCRLRPHAQGLGHRIHAGNRSAARANRLYVHFRNEVLVLRHIGDERIRWLSAVHDAHIERGAPHVRCNDVGTTNALTQKL